MPIYRTHKLACSSLIAVAALQVASCKGPTGPEGVTGSSGLSAVQIVSVAGTVQPVQNGSASATGILSLRVDCPAGKTVIAGGYAAVGDGSQFVHPWQSFPISTSAWVVSVQNGYVGPIAVTAFATCAITQN